MQADFIIVGAGAAGCVLADRLSSDGRSRVLVVEAGGMDRHPLIHIPAGFYYLLRNSSLGWGYQTDPEPGLNGRRVVFPRGKVVGGSGSINGLWQSRGLPLDYDSWVEAGGSEWSYDSLLPYFRKSESFRTSWPHRSGDHRGERGPIPVVESEVHPLTAQFFRGLEALKIPELEDYNSQSGEGFAKIQQTRRGRFRATAASGYLQPALRRPNVTLITGAQVTGITFEGRTATGISFERTRGKRETASARREVILAAGAINSPHLLQLSGVGPGGLLKSKGIEPILDSPGVGHNLHDHFTGRVVTKVGGVPSLNQSSRAPRLWPQVASYLLRGTGILTYSAANGTVFLKSTPAEPDPDLQFVFSPASYSPEGGGRLDKFSAVTCGCWLMRPESRGSLELGSNDPYDAPRFTLGYLKEEGDRCRMIAGIRWARRLLQAGFGADFEEVRPGTESESDEEILGYLKQTGGTVFHPVGSCRFGRDEGAVLDPDLRVRGVDRLRVVDASVMPTVPSSNTHAPVIAIAEKAADLIGQSVSASTSVLSAHNPAA
ncbi:GMC family oxidoreductase N-terminal domain-containing protein [Mesorhizobium sp. CCNWLW179-1]|uniref:GMC family oxidoreductase n=1 Tax=unclassified Mesorhizobium TaxID=325217 RepID=UPI00301457A7